MEKEKQELKYFVRIANTDLDGKKPIYHSLTSIKGVGPMFANMLCNIAKIDRNKKTGYLSKEEAELLDKILADPSKYNAPEWMFNRRRDVEDNVSKHLVTSNLEFVTGNDIKIMKKIKSYKGMRHAAGLPVRGQRTKSNFRKNKGKVMGVKRSPTAKAGK